MAIIIQEVTAEIPEAAPRPPQPHDAGSSADQDRLTLVQLRAALLRDAQRQERLWAD